MPTFQRCDASVTEMAASLIKEFHPHLIDARVKIDYMFAYADVNDKGEQTNDALKLHGVKALGIARKIGTKDRVKGMGDAEISLDADWWGNNDDEERRALLDHELHHITVKKNRAGVMETDNIGRPKVFLRPHDYQFGWFNTIAQRHGKSSQEVKQATHILHESGQYYFPGVMENLPQSRNQRLELHQ